MGGALLRFAQGRGTDECVRPHMGSGAIQVHDFFGYGEDAGLAGDEQEAVMGFAAEPARPVQTTVVKGTVEAVARQRFGNESSQTFH